MLTARGNLVTAITAIQNCLIEAGAIDLAEVPGAEPSRKKLLHQAANLARGNSQWPAQQTMCCSARAKAAATTSLADILVENDDLVTAAPKYRYAIAISRPFAESDPQLKAVMALAHGGLGNIYRKTNRFKLAEDEFREAIRIADEMSRPDRTALVPEILLRKFRYQLATLLARDLNGQTRPKRFTRR